MGYIYLIENEVEFETFYKIGYTKNLNNRKRQLSTGNPGKMKILKSFRTDWNRKVEITLHMQFKSKRIRGEWFRLDNNDVDNFLPKCHIIESNLNFLKQNGNSFV